LVERLRKSHLVYGFNKVDYSRKDLNTYEPKIGSFPAGQNPVEGNVLKWMLPGWADMIPEPKARNLTYGNFTQRINDVWENSWWS